MRAAVVLVFVAACTNPIAGTRVSSPSRSPSRPPGPAIATALASDPAGIRVLANGNGASGDAGLLATTPDEYAALWHDVGLRGARPAIDFTTHVVLGTNFDGGVCQPEIVAATIDAAGILALQEAPIADACILLGSREIRVVAIPRSLLPPHFTWRTDNGDFAFVLAPRSAIATVPHLVIDTGARTSIARSRGAIDLPAIGRIALRTLDDGREIWVARRDTDDISVVLADRPSRTPGLHHALSWNDKVHRFSSGHDSRGRSIHGGPPLEVLAFSRTADDRISIGDAITVAYAPPIPRTDEPALDGPEKPYTSPSKSFRGIADNHWGVIADSLVIGTSGTAQLCTIPEGKARQYLSGCLRSHPTVSSIRARRTNGTRGISMTHGPLAIHRTGDTADVVIDLGNGESGWVVEHALLKPAPRGPTTQRGPLPVKVAVHGSTAGGNNGYEAPDDCVPIVGRGSPDDAWTFTAPRAGTYIFELEATYDAALYVMDLGAPTDYTFLGCNDDAKGFFRRSLIRIDLAAMAKLRVVVDGFGGARGGYKLTVHEQPPLPRLVVGSSVTGDTTHAIDQESHGCFAPAGDHRIPVHVDTAGLYAFRIDTPGWAPMISVFAAGGSEFGCYTHQSPLIDLYLLEPGDYFVVVDGSDTKQRGRYTLSANRCPTDDKAACKMTMQTRR